MSYASAAYGSTSVSGISSALQTFFSPQEDLTIGAYRRTVEYTGNADYYQVLLHMVSFGEEPLREMRILTHNDPGETPQLQATLGEAFYSQSIVGAARFIVVELELLAELSQIDVAITGSEYFQ